MSKNRNIKLSLVKGTSANIVGTTTLFQLLKKITTDEKMISDGKELKDFYLNDYQKYRLKKDYQNGFIIGEFSYRNVDSCIEYVPYLGFDIDKVKKESEKKRIFNILKKWDYSYLVIPSLSGLGIRLLVEANSTKENHKEIYNELSVKLSALIEIPLKSKLREAFKNLGFKGKTLNEKIEENTHVDDSMNDISRFWYYSGLERSEIFLNKDAKVYEKQPVVEQIDFKEKTKTSNDRDYPYKFTSKDKVEYLVSQIERHGIDITSGFRDWFKVGLALANEFGESGREYFYSVSKFHPAYDIKESKKEYDRCLTKGSKGKGQTVTILSFYSYCKTYGVQFDWKDLVEIHKDKFPVKSKTKQLQKTVSDNKKIIEEKSKEVFHFIDAERAIVGASLIDSSLLQEAYDHCPKFSNECFVDEDCKNIFQAIQSLFVNGLDVNVISVNSKLQDLSIEYLTQFTTGNIFKEHVRTSVDIVYQAFLKRRLLSITNECTVEISNNDHDVFEYVDTMSSKLSSLGDYGHSKNEDTAFSAMSKVAERLIKLKKHYIETGGKGLTGVPTGINSEDEFTAGFQESGLYILAARPGMGKTAKCLRTLLEASKQGYAVGMFSLEMSNTQLVSRLLTMESQVRSEKLKIGSFNETETDIVNQTIERLAQLPFYLDDSAGASTAYVLRQATKWKRKHDIKLLIVDYLQLMTDGGMYKGNKVQQITEISRQLKLIAKKLNIPVLALSQLSRSVETRGGTKRPQLSDLRESGAIEQDADAVTFIYRPEYYDITQDEEGNNLKGKAELIYAKHRDGETGSVWCNFDSSTVSFYDSDDYAPKVMSESNFLPDVKIEKREAEALELFEMPEEKEDLMKNSRPKESEIKF